MAVYAPTANPPSVSEPAFGIVAIDDVLPPSFQDILRAWRGQCDGAAFPPVGKIDPFVVPSLVPNLILYQVSENAITFRVVGEKVVTAAGTNLKGLTRTEAFGDTPYIRRVEQQLRECANSGAPIYSCQDFQLRNDIRKDTLRSGKVWRIALPYGEDGRVTRLLCYQLFSQEIRAHDRKKLDFDALRSKSGLKIEF